MANPDPIVGAWKLNRSKSRLFSDLPIDVGQDAKEATEVYQEVGDQIELTLTGTKLSGELFSGKVRWPRDGGIASSIQEVPSYGDILIVETLFAPGDWYATYLKDGRQVVVIHKAISEDGRTMRLISKQADSQGNLSEQTVVYDRQ